MLFPNQIMKCHIKAFWDNFGGNKTRNPEQSEEFRLSLLKEYAEIKIHFKSQQSLPVRRERFNNVKKHRHSLYSHAKCWVCDSVADVRHHIIQLKNGGINSSRNLVSLCNHCHSEVHPHLKFANKYR